MLREEWGCSRADHKGQMSALKKVLKRSVQRETYLNPLCKREDWQNHEGSIGATGARWEGTPEEPVCCDSLWGDSRQAVQDVQPRGG